MFCINLDVCLNIFECKYVIFELLCLVLIIFVFDYFQSNRLDICCCVKLEKLKKNEVLEGILFKIFKNFYLEVLLFKFV